MSAPPHTNRLIDSTSPYLLQHAHNPVDWRPWGEEALRIAREEERPIFLSIGYAACHWCHVMERESFESESIAEILNRDFVPIKVDREERPDLDEIYMAATQLLTHSGGWPMSVFLTPELKPFYAGTYFPPEDRWGRPGFKTLLTEIARAWRERRPTLLEQAERITAAVEQYTSGGTEQGVVGASLVRNALQELTRSFDSRDGGFGGAPKFPPSMRLELLLDRLREGEDERLRPLLTVTLDMMARGGMYDQVGGGFHRYSVDERWLVPHFEKMLYDNALLARIYTLAFEESGSWFYGRVAREIFDYVIREMTSAEGGFYSTTDADSEGEEGKFFVWSPAQVEQVLGKEGGQLFCRIYDVTAGGNFEGHSIPNLLQRSLDERAAERKVEPAALDLELAPLRRKLWEHRERRIHPLLDDKILSGWNGLMIRAFAEGYRVFGDERYRAAAENAAGFVLERMRDGGRLLRSYRGGKAMLNAYQEDYAYLAVALLDLHAASSLQSPASSVSPPFPPHPGPRKEDREERREPNAPTPPHPRTPEPPNPHTPILPHPHTPNPARDWLAEGLLLLDEMDREFRDEESGGYFFTSHGHEKLIARTRSFQDGATPSGNSMAALALIRAARLTGEDRYRRQAASVLSVTAPMMSELPAAFPNMLVAVDEFLAHWPEGIRVPGAEAVELEGYLSHTVVRPGDRLYLGVKVQIREGYHVNSHQPRQEYLIPTALTLEPVDGFRVTAESYPAGQEYLPQFASPDGEAPESLSVYEGTLYLGVEVELAAGTRSGRYTLPLTLRLQPCDEGQCYPPLEARLRFNVCVAEQTGPEQFPEVWRVIRDQVDLR